MAVCQMGGLLGKTGVGGISRISGLIRLHHACALGALRWSSPRLSEVCLVELAWHCDVAACQTGLERRSNLSDAAISLNFWRWGSVLCGVK